MSTTQATPQYLVSWYGRYLDCGAPHSIHGPDGHIVDAFRTRSCAEYACRLLNQGLATVDPHALVGCRVIAS